MEREGEGGRGESREMGEEEDGGRGGWTERRKKGEVDGGRGGLTEIMRGDVLFSQWH